MSSEHDSSPAKGHPQPYNSVIKEIIDVVVEKRASTDSERPIIMAQPSQNSTEKCLPGVPPRTDSSWEAFRVFLAAVWSAGFLVGICLSFGVFQDFYTNEADLPNNGHSSWIGLLAVGIDYLGCPAVTYCCQTFNIPCHYYVYSGWVLCLAGLLSSAFCHNVKALIATQGLLFGLGILLVEMPTLIILDSWFVKRRGLAYGALFGMMDLFGVAWGFVANALLNRHGIKITFLVFTAICFVFPAVATYFLRERPSTAKEMPSETSSVSDAEATNDLQADATTVPFTKRYYRHATFYVLIAANLLQSFAYYLPFVYLPSYTTALGHSSSTGATVLAIANVAMIFGEIGFGRLSDKAKAPTLVFCSAAVSSLAAFLLWSFASSLAFLIPFALLFGAFAAGYAALWPRIGTMFGEKDASMIYSLLSFGRGIAVIASGPISTALLHGRHISSGQTSSSVQHEYQPIVMFVGACMAGSAVLGAVGWILSHRKTKSSLQARSEAVV
ncbi:hypothetical protein H2200_000707 [Cladophialophora chaetospira]|uniref:MFS general substrate transporter n=1 Tax=Cladophialophora chaetospira TaxID=386627 RepID=A0AA38XPT1_9EURO|nr:hypothetical protein H2200_000707 [Cladophialophora chaetospira]